MRDANAQDRRRPRPALASEPQVELPNEEDAIEAVVEGKADLAYTVAMESCRRSSSRDFKDIKLERLIAEVTDAEIDEALEHDRRAEPAVRRRRARAPRPRTATRSRSPSPARSTARRSRAAPATTSPCIIGSDSFIPGFEEQLVGINGGREAHRQGDVPADLPEGRSCRQGRRLRRHGEVDRGAAAVTIDDEFAKPLGMEFARQAPRDGEGPHRPASTPRMRGRSSSASCSTRSTSATSSSCRRRWSSRSSRTSGRRSRTTSSSRAAPSRTKAPPKKRRRPNTARSPSAACGSAW